MPSPVPPGPDEPAEAPYTGGSGLSPASDPDRYDPSRDVANARGSQPGRRPSPFPYDEAPPEPAAGWREDISHTAPIPILPPDFVPADLPQDPTPAGVVAPAAPLTPGYVAPHVAETPPYVVPPVPVAVAVPVAAPAADPLASVYPSFTADAHQAPSQAVLDSVTMMTVVDEPHWSAVATLAPPRVAASWLSLIHWSTSAWAASSSSSSFWYSFSTGSFVFSVLTEGGLVAPATRLVSAVSGLAATRAPSKPSKNLLTASS